MHEAYNAHSLIKLSFQVESIAAYGKLNLIINLFNQVNIYFR